MPYVFFASPGEWQAWPKSAACWSPAMPAIGTSTPSIVAWPQIADEGTTRGSTARGMSRSASSSSSQSPSRMSKSSVRLAFDGSVTCTAPRVRFQTSHESMVPKASSPFAARARAPGTLSSSHLSLVPEK